MRELANPVWQADLVSASINPAANQSVCAQFEQQVERTPEALALICEGRQMTYRELEARVNQLAWHLKTQYQIESESFVGLLLGRSERMLISMLAVLKAGGAYVPISPDYPAKRIDYILRDANPKVLITEKRFASAVERFQELFYWDDWPDAGEEAAMVPRSNLPEPEQLAYLMYTSGSTGVPKGVLTEHGNLSNFISWCIDEYRHSTFDIVYAGTPYGFDLSNIEFYFPLAIGRPIRLLPASQMVGLYLRRDRRVLLNTVPSLVQELLKTRELLNNVSVLNLGGEAVPLSLGRVLRSYPGMEIRNMYGPTETTSTAINYRIDGATSPEMLIGKPIAMTVVYILDEEMRQVPIGTRGEIYIGGKGVARGYWNRPELTQERFLDDPFTPGERLYRTGDLGMYLPDGNLRFFGRNDNQIKLHGFRIELDEIGRQLEGHESVREAVAGLKKSERGDKLVAVCSLCAEVSAEALIAYLKDILPPYMLPDEIIFRENFPLTPAGKIDRSALFTEGRI